MFVRIHSPKNYGNTGSCSGIVEYLEKENQKLYQENEQMYLEQRQMFFNHTNDSVSSNTVVLTTDNNCSKLGKCEARYFMLSVNPSQKELKFLASQISGRKVNTLDQLTLEERRIFESQLRDYTRSVMDVYARNFNKDRTLTGDDLLYHAKIEHERRYSRFDEEVKKGIRKDGDLKEGFQSHVHVVVSRKDISNRIKLSPFTNHKSSENLVNGKKVPMGFNRKEFVEKCEKVFDQKFGYQRDMVQSFQFRYVMKNIAAQAMNRYLPGYSIIGKISRLQKGMSSQDELKKLTSIFMQNKYAAQLINTIQAAYRPEKLAIEISKKIVKSVIEGSKLSI